MLNKQGFLLIDAIGAVAQTSRSPGTKYGLHLSGLNHRSRGKRPQIKAREMFDTDRKRECRECCPILGPDGLTEKYQYGETMKCNEGIFIASEMSHYDPSRQDRIPPPGSWMSWCNLGPSTQVSTTPQSRSRLKKQGVQDRDPFKLATPV